MKKSLCILDTNVLLNDPYALYAFHENDVTIPIAVIEEIDAMKSRNDSVGFNARLTSRLLDNLRKQGRLDKGVELGTGGTLKIEIDRNGHLIPEGLAQDRMDNRILKVAFTALEELGGEYERVVIISMDINMRIKAEALGMNADDYAKDRVEYKTSYPGFVELEVAPQEMEQFFQEGSVPISWHSFNPYECVNLMCGNQSGLGMYRKDTDRVQALALQNIHPWGIRPHNREQRFALELLLNDDIPIVTICGKAGTGKTLLALAAGLHKVTEEQRYWRLLVARPVVPMGRDIGYLPGDKDEKLRPWMQPIYDNLDLLLHSEGKNRRDLDVSIKFLEQKEFIQIEPLTYIRGRSIPDQYLIVDEAQNLSKHEIKTIVTRAGKGTKIVLTGDPEQIDNPYLDENNNGLTYAADRLKEQIISGHITLMKGERSPLAEIGAKVL